MKKIIALNIAQDIDFDTTDDTASTPETPDKIILVPETYEDYIKLANTYLQAVMYHRHLPYWMRVSKNSVPENRVQQNQSLTYLVKEKGMSLPDRWQLRRAAQQTDIMKTVG